ncbi:DinB family protein [Fundidesulfovibrio soli]|uniref:DinB family protein n=1 Tax=Fundidesulfovibrio soli TaxID=2922716 RepID=UPI001FAEE963|nr:DinB family protein [Fundidesulfovibrio soli]
MATPEQLVQGIRENMKQLAQACEGLDEATASRAPVGRWSPKQILSHLSGPEGMGMLPLLRAFLEADTPRIDLETENPFFTDKRESMPFTELLEGVRREYEAVAAFTSTLTPDQLARTAHIPAFKDTPLGERPSLEQMIFGLTDFHVRFHTDHLREVVAALRAPGGA